MLEENRYYIEGIRNQNQQVIRQFFDTYYPILYRFIRVQCFNEEDVADILQEVFYKAFTRIEQFRGDARIKTWLLSIARNEIRQFLRKQQNWDRKVEKATWDAESRQELAVATEDIVLLRVQEEELIEAIQLLDEKKRQVVILRLLEECSIKETALILDLTISDVKVSYHRGLQEIRKQLLEQHMKGVEAQ